MYTFCGAKDSQKPKNCQASQARDGLHPERQAWRCLGCHRGRVFQLRGRQLRDAQENPSAPSRRLQSTISEVRKLVGFTEPKFACHPRIPFYSCFGSAYPSWNAQEIHSTLRPPQKRPGTRTCTLELQCLYKVCRSSVAGYAIIQPGGSTSRIPAFKFNVEESHPSANHVRESCAGSVCKNISALRYDFLR